MTQGKILLERKGDVAVIRINDPATRNALTWEMVGELRELVRQAQTEARAIVLAGGEKGFCSGAALSDGGAGARSGELDAGLILEEQINPALLELQDLRVPLVTAIRGAAAGVGASFALMGDIIVAGRGAYFLQAFSRIGLIPDGGSPWLLTRAIGRVRAMELMLLGDRLSAEQAYAWGMVTRLVDDEDVEDTAMELATRLASGPALALARTRKVAWAANDSSFAEELRLERGLQREAGLHPDFREGVEAFLQKRPARFQGASSS